MKFKAVGLVGFVWCGATFAVASPAAASSILFSNLTVVNSMAAASRPGAAGKIEIEAADDFILSTPATITSASFIGLVPAGFSVNDLNLEIYRIFPTDSG